MGCSESKYPIRVDSKTKLYFTSSFGGNSTFLAAYCAGISIPCEVVVFPLEALTASGINFESINPSGELPALVFGNGTILSGDVAIMGYIADKNPGSIAPLAESADAYLMQEVLHVVVSPLHSSIALLRNAGQDAQIRDFLTLIIKKKLIYINDVLLKDKMFVVGSTLSIADIYLYTVLSWILQDGADGFDAVSETPDMEGLLNIKRYCKSIEEIDRIKQGALRLDARDDNNIPIPPTYTLNPVMNATATAKTLPVDDIEDKTSNILSPGQSQDETVVDPEQIKMNLQKIMQPVLESSKEGTPAFGVSPKGSTPTPAFINSPDCGLHGSNIEPVCEKHPSSIAASIPIVNTDTPQT